MRPALYCILFLGQTLGDATILAHLIPLFRKLVTSGLAEKTSSGTLILAELSVVLIQVCYWLNQHWFETIRLRRNSLVGHLLLFFARLNFVGAAGVFSAVFLVRYSELEISLWRLLLLSAVLFSIFCYSLELERLGKALGG